MTMENKEETIMLKNKRGQSTLEYIILVTAVVAVLLVFLGPSAIFQNTLNTTLSQVSGTMNMMANRYVNSIPNK